MIFIGIICLFLIQSIKTQSTSEMYRPWSGNITEYVSEFADLEINCAARCTNIGVMCVGYTYANGKCHLIKSYSKCTSQDTFHIKDSMIATKILVVGGMVNGINNYVAQKSAEIISIIPGEICKGGVNIDMPLATYSSTGQVFQGKPTVCGGWVTYNVNLKKCYAYDPISRKWNTLPDMLYTQGWGGSAISNGRLFIMASWGQANTQFFDGVGWSPGTNAGVGPSRSCGVQLDEDRSMMTGGGGVEKKTYIYSRRTKKWTSGPDMVANHYDHACVTMPDGKVMVVGGPLAPTVTEILDPTTMKWTRLPDSTVSFNQAYLVIAGGVPILTGGDGTSFKGVYKWENNIWIKLSIELSTKRTKHTAFPLDANVEC